MLQSSRFAPRYLLGTSACLTLFLALTSCAVYHPAALPDASDLSQSMLHTTVARQDLHLPVPSPDPFDPADGLDMIQAATLAVLRSPDLRVARADAGVSRAQAFSAGLLPDPQLGLAHDLTPTGAFSAGLTADLVALISHSALANASRNDQQAADLNLLWQEWQTVTATEDAFVRCVFTDESVALLTDRLTGATALATEAEKAIDQGLQVRTVVGPLIAARSDIERQLADTRKLQSQAHHDLNLLLGLDVTAAVRLKPIKAIPEPNGQQIDAALADLPHRRPDLMALQRGFDAEDARYRAALLAQFPLLNVSLTRSRDNTQTYSSSLGLTISLPSFNRNRGAIRIEQATRERLIADYQNRLDGAVADAHRILRDEQMGHEALSRANVGSSELNREAARARTAFESGLIDALAYMAISTEALNRDVEVLGLRQSLMQESIALNALLGDVSAAQTGAHP